MTFMFFFYIVENHATIPLQKTQKWIQSYSHQGCSFHLKLLLWAILIFLPCERVHDFQQFKINSLINRLHNEWGLGCQSQLTSLFFHCTFHFCPFSADNITGLVLAPTLRIFPTPQPPIICLMYSSNLANTFQLVSLLI